MTSSRRRSRRLRSGLRLGGTLVASLILLAGVGCAGYKLGPTNGLTAGARSIQLQPFANDTLQPGLSDAVTFALRQSVQQDGTYKLATHETGDLIVSGTLKSYIRSIIDYNPRDMLTPLDYRVTVFGHVTARDRVTGKLVLDRDVAGFTLVRPGPDLTSAERQAMPLLAQDLARNITALLVDGTW